MSRGVALRLALYLPVCMGGLLLAAPASSDVSPGTVAVAMTLADDGVLNITETITPAKGQVLQRHLLLDVPVEGNRIQHFQVSNVTSTGDAEAAGDTGTLTIVARGPATVSYAVRGAVADAADHQQVTWPFASGWDSGMRDVTASFASPNTKPSSPRAPWAHRVLAHVVLRRRSITPGWCESSKTMCRRTRSQPSP